MITEKKHLMEGSRGKKNNQYKRAGYPRAKWPDTEVGTSGGLVNNTDP